MTAEEKDLLDYYSMDSEMYGDGFRHGVEKAFERLTSYIDIFKEREECYKPMCTIDEYKRCEGAIYAFDEVLALINELKEEFE